ncbi:DUF995 domain-containing protein [Microvirga sp. 3-52]|nr:DUF995 domain-containing protein [Microvirga sp. 3-52]
MMLKVYSMSLSCRTQVVALRPPNHLALAGAAFIGVAQLTTAFAKDLPAKAVRLSDAEVRALYEGNTWNQKDECCGFYFASDGTFIAIGRIPGKGDLVHGAGKWAVDEDKMCMVGTWTNKAGSGTHEECFIHAKADGTIYKNRSNGKKSDWWFFRQAKPNPADEANRVKPGDSVTPRVNAFKATIG